MKVTAFRPSAKSWDITASSTRTPVAVSRPKASPIASPSVNVYRESGGAQRADTGMRLRLLRIVSVVQDEVPVGDEEEDEPRTDEGHHPVLVPDSLERLRNEVEQRDGNDDAAREGDRRLQLAVQAQTEASARKRGHDR